MRRASVISSPAARGRGPRRTGAGMRRSMHTNPFTRRPFKGDRRMDEARAVTKAAGVAVVIPCHNEEATIAKVVGDFQRHLAGARIVVIDNASSDATTMRAREAGAEVFGESRRGKGYALLRGFQAVREASFVVMVDGDDTYPAEEAQKLLDCVQSGAAD